MYLHQFYLYFRYYQTTKPDNTGDLTMKTINIKWRTSTFGILCVWSLLLCVSNALHTSMTKVTAPAHAKPGHIITFLPYQDGQSYNVRHASEEAIANLFTVMKNGQLITKSSLSHLHSQSIYIIIEHIYQSSSWSQMLHVELLPESEGLHFEGQPYEGHINENQPRATLVKGLDHFYTSIQKFPLTTNVTIVSGDVEMFQIKPIVAWAGNDVLLMSKLSLDREENSCYHLTVKAEDIGKQEIFALVTIYVDDVNDNIPVFDSSFYSSIITRTDEPRSIITQVTAHDKDGDDIMTYMLDGDASSKMFSLNQQTGEIFTNGPLQVDKTYTFSIYAVDQDGHMSVPATVEVTSEIPEVIMEQSEIIQHSRHRREAAKRVFVIDRSTTGDLFTVAQEFPVEEERFAFVEPGPTYLDMDPITGMVKLVNPSWDGSVNTIDFSVNVTRTDSDCKY